MLGEVGRLLGGSAFKVSDVTILGGNSGNKVRVPRGGERKPAACLVGVASWESPP